MIGLLNASAAGTGPGSDPFGGTGLKASGPPGAPKIREGRVTVHGHLPPEVVARIVRQRFGAFRLCYEAGLRKLPTLSGQVAVHFVIDASGAVSKTEREATTTMPDADVVSCVVRSVATLSFPQPEGGPVDVVYPVRLELAKAGDVE